MTWNLPRGYVARNDGPWWTLYAGEFGSIIHTTDAEAFTAKLKEMELA